VNSHPDVRQFTSPSAAVAFSHKQPVILRMALIICKTSSEF
jgi:hypothetical protein